MNYNQELYELNSAEISDALDACGIEGALLDIKPLSLGMKLVGPAFTVKYLPYEDKLNDFKGAGDYIDDVSPQSVIVIDNEGRKDCTTWGSILTQVALMKNIAGTVVNGAIRDVDFIRYTQYPIYSNAVYMRSGKNRVYKFQQQCNLLINNVIINPGDIIFADDNGVIVIPKNLIKEIINKAKTIRATENSIVESVKSGSTLKDARKKYHYETPWLNNK